MKRERQRETKRQKGRKTKLQRDKDIKTLVLDRIKLAFVIADI